MSQRCMTVSCADWRWLHTACSVEPADEASCCIGGQQLLDGGRCAAFCYWVCRRRSLTSVARSSRS